MLSHRRKDVRDTAKYPPLMKPQARQNVPSCLLVHAVPAACRCLLLSVHVMLWAIHAYLLLVYAVVDMCCS